VRDRDDDLVYLSLLLRCGLRLRWRDEERCADLDDDDDEEECPRRLLEYLLRLFRLLIVSRLSLSFLRARMALQCFCTTTAAYSFFVKYL